MKNRTYNIIVFLSVISPVIINYIFLLLSSDTGSGAFALFFFSIAGAPIVGILGLLISVVLRICNVQDKKWTALCYVVLGLLVSFVFPLIYN